MTVKANVFIQAGPSRSFYSSTEEIFDRNGKYNIVTDIDKASIVVWTGGEDICPLLYGEKPLPNVHYSSRDKSDIEAVKKAYEGDKFLVGICRGAQLLNVIPNDGRLWQDVDNHQGTHQAFDCVTGNWITVNSVHHQMMVPTEKAEVICWADTSRTRKSDKIVWSKPSGILKEKDKDIEVLWYPATRSLCFQAHPEFNHLGTRKYFFGLMDKFYWGL